MKRQISICILFLLMFFSGCRVINGVMGLGCWWSMFGREVTGLNEEKMLLPIVAEFVYCGDVRFSNIDEGATYKVLFSAKRPLLHGLYLAYFKNGDNDHCQDFEIHMWVCHNGKEYYVGKDRALWGDCGGTQQKPEEVWRYVMKLDVCDFPWFYADPIEVKVKVLKTCKKHKFPIGTVRFFLCEDNTIGM